MLHEIKIKHGNNYISLPVRLLRSSRKSIGIEVRPGGEIIIRAPRYVTLAQIGSFVEEHNDWLYNNYMNQVDKQTLSEVRRNERLDPRLAYLEKKYRAAAKKYIYERVEYYLPMTGGAYSRLRIADQKTRWGSCTSGGTLSFSWRLMLAPPRVLDYVVIHELCHLTYMNHSKEFWDKVASIDPNYKEHKKWLKENGDTLILK